MDVRLFEILSEKHDSTFMSEELANKTGVDTVLMSRAGLCNPIPGGQLTICRTTAAVLSVRWHDFAKNGRCLCL